MIKPIKPDRVNDYSRYMLKSLMLFCGVPLIFGLFVKPLALAFIVFISDYLWHVKEKINNDTLR